MTGAAAMHTETPRLVHGSVHARRGRWVRRVVIGVLVAFVAAGLSGAFGYRETSATVSTSDYLVTLTHPAVTRGGLPARWSLRLGAQGVADLPSVEIRTTAEYFDLFDLNGLDPEPDSTWQDDEVVWTYRPDGRRQLEVSLDVRTQPDARWRYRARTVVLAGDEVIASFDYQTIAMP